MSYATYTTEAIVCGSYDSHTSDRSYLLFTRDAGMVWASAKSVREERSKQRYALQDFSIARVSLVKGKSGWRIGSALSLGNPFLGAHSRAQRGYVTYLITQVRRYVQGEVPMPELFDDMITLLERADEDARHNEALQSIFLLRLLKQLGYVAPEEGFSVFWEGSITDTMTAAYTPSIAQKAQKAIERATNASHL